jgi:hypothetical protein
VFDWLFEGRVAVYVALAAAGFVLLLAWWNTRRRFWLISFAVVLLLAGTYFLLDRLVETDREQIGRKLQEMAAAVQARNPAAIMAHVSDDFQVRGHDRATFQGFVERALRERWVDQVVVWDFFFPDDFRGPAEVRRGGEVRPRQVARMSFRAKPIGGRVGENAGFPCEARFVRDPDGQWRLLDFEVFNPVITNQPEPVPGL